VPIWPAETHGRDAAKGTVTSLFVDAEGSTKRFDGVGLSEYAHLLGIDHEAMRDAVPARKGVVVMTEGDAVSLGFGDQ
jgi:class 3 adenylate cyclase